MKNHKIIIEEILWLAAYAVMLLIWCWIASGALPNFLAWLGD